MYLERLDIHGFKSFAKKTTIVFDARPNARPGVTAIVGPNGSGKSVIGESIRWVLGEQSSKALRSKKMEEVIFSGSEKKAQLGMAEVTITLNNEDKSAPIDATHIAITRRLFRDGASEYLVNGQATRLHDIELLLAKAHFGQRTYSVIGQGMVDEILIVSPRERKTFFDEAAGVTQYQLKRDESLRKLDAARANLHEADVVLTELTPRLRSLTRHVHRLERREEIERELRDLQQQYYGSKVAWLVALTQTERLRVTDLAKTRTAAERDLASVAEKLKALEKETTQSEAFTALQRDYRTLIERQNAIREKQFALKNDLVRLEGKRKAPLGVPVGELTTFLEEIAAVHEKVIGEVLAARTIEALDKAKPALAALHARVQTFRARLTAPTDDTKGDREKAEKDLADLGKELEQSRTELARIERDLAQLGKEEKEKKSEFFTLQRAFQDAQNAVNAAREKENEVRIALARLEQRHEDLRTEMEREAVVVSSPSTPAAADIEALMPEIQKRKRALEEIGGIDPETVSEYHKTKERHDFLSAQTTDLTTTIAQLEEAIAELDETIKDRFHAAFATINTEFQKFFKILFGGGAAHLVLVKDEENVEIAGGTDDAPALRSPAGVGGKKKKSQMIVGIDVQATPPGKRVKSVAMLSGGERALTAIALIGSFISFNPSPFVVLDEADAALDEANSERFSRIIDALSNKTQFIAITHNRATMERAASLYGITMGDDGVSKVLSVKFEEAAKAA